ncbi:UNVERIFIED_CONTAM: hypothetical protein Sangu_2917500 [Sesamum angustifolium]|uniref:Uncharacterized protein n=1 Tax=Sesamum angustifolium TaxID=2727405 RepID=A0AAW2ILJ7_9LAMI
METSINTANKQKVVGSDSNSKLCRWLLGRPPTSVGGDPLAPLALVPCPLELSVPWLIPHDVELPRIPPKKNFLQPC